MPIVDVELVSDHGPAPRLAAELADAIGDVLGAAPGSTWVRLRRLVRVSYGESGGDVDSAIQPAFVTVLAGRSLEDEALAVEASELATAVAELTGHPRSNVHIIYAPDARGRVAFGGRLVPRSTG